MRLLSRQLKRSFATVGSQPKQIYWRLNNLGVEIHLQDPNTAETVLFQSLPEITLQSFFGAFKIPLSQVKFPSGVQAQTKIIDLLLNKQTPQEVHIHSRGENLVLKNRAKQTFVIGCSDSISTDIRNSIQAKDSIYQHFVQFQQDYPSESTTEAENYLIRYYLRLQAERYCREKNIKMDSILSEATKADIMEFLSKENQINCLGPLEQTAKQKLKLSIAIAETTQKIDEINQSYEKKEKIYKNLAILITFIHMTSFGYMIFGVEWLGWDIIEPLTYTSTVIYTLLGIRFYRKYKVDRTSQTIRDALFKMIMPHNVKSQLKENVTRLGILQKQMKKLDQETLLLKNSLAYRTSLIDSLKASVLQSK